MGEQVRIFAGITAGLSTAYACDLGSDHGSIDKVQRQQFQTRIVPRNPQIPVQELKSEIPVVVKIKVHDYESDLTHHIDPPELLIELQAVKQTNPVCDKHHIPKVQITVAFTHEPIPFPNINKIPASGKP